VTTTPREGLLLIGESPSKRGVPGDAALAGRIGTRLSQLLGISSERYLEGVARVNLLPDFIGKAPGARATPWPAKEAKQAAQQLLASGFLNDRALVVLLGTRVAAAFGLKRPKWFQETDLRLQTDLRLPDGATITVAVAPHPSGANWWWNDKTNAKQAGTFWRQVAVQAGLAPAKRPRRQPQQPKGAAIKDPVSLEQVDDLQDVPESVKAAFEPLSAIERKFVVHYCTAARGNALLAAKMAGLALTQKYNKDKERKASELAQFTYRWIHSTRIRKAINAWLEAFALGGVELTKQLADAALANVGPFVRRNRNGSLSIHVDSDFDWDAHKHWIKEVETNKDGVVTRVAVVDPMQARRELAKIMKLYSDQPILALNLYLQSMSDEAILSRLNELKALNQAASGDRAQLPGAVGTTVDAEYDMEEDDAGDETPEP